MRRGSLGKEKPCASRELALRLVGQRLPQDGEDGHGQLGDFYPHVLIRDMDRTTTCLACGGPLPREVFCNLCGAGLCSADCETAHRLPTHPASATTVSMSADNATPQESTSGVVPFAGLTLGTPVCLTNGGRGVVLRCYADRGTVRVLYRLGSADLEGLFGPDELAPANT